MSIATHEYALNIEDIEQIAVATGAIKAGAHLTPELLEFAFAVAERCASIGDHYTTQHGNAGEDIRNLFAIG